MEVPEVKERNLLLSADINQNSINPIITSILNINEDDSQKESTYKIWNRKPILLFINSDGGSVYDGLALVDTIKCSSTPVKTICIGRCMSMALWIWLASDSRLIGRNGLLMYHDVTSFICGKTAEVKQELEESLRLQKLFTKEIIEKSLITEPMLQEHITKKSEWYIPARKAITLKLATGYYDKIK